MEDQVPIPSKSDNRSFNMSHTLHNSINRIGQCTKRWRAEMIDKIVDRESKDYFDKGLYFESSVIGNADNTVLPSTEWMYTKSGALTADATRIEQQIQKFKNMFNPESDHYKHFKILEPTQERLEIKVNGINHKGFLDMRIVDLLDDTFDFYITDLKLLGNIYSSPMYNPLESSFNKYQVLYYKHLYCMIHNIPHERVGTAYLLFDYSTDMEQAFVKVNSPKELCEMVFESHVESVQEINSMYDSYGESIDEWPTLPNKKNCLTCTLKCGDKWDDHKLKVYNI